MKRSSPARATLLTAAFLSACGRYGYERLAVEVEWEPPVLTSGPSRDAGSTTAVDTADASSHRAQLDAGFAGDASGIDAGAPQDSGLPPLVSLGPFGAPRLMDEVTPNGTTADDPSATDDRLLLFFNSSRSGGLGSGDIWGSVRATPTDPWSTPVLSSVSSPGRETTPGISRDGLSLWFGSDRAGPGACATGGGLDIWVATRAARDEPFGTPVCVDELSGPADELGPSLSADGLTILITINDGSFSKLYTATRSRIEDPFGAPTLIGELAGPRGDGDGCLAREGREIFFATDRDDPSSTSLMTATRASSGEPFGDLSYVTELNSSAADSDPWVSSDGRYIVWTSHRSGSQLLYEATR